MKKIGLILISFILCAVFSVTHGWIWFFPVYLLFSYKNLSPSLIWEIPLGCFGASVLMLFLSTSHPELFRALIPCAALLISISKPKKLFIFFPLAILMLALKNNEAGIYTMAAAIVCSFHKLYHKTAQFTSITY